MSRIHFRGGSHIGISRANPTKDPQLLENTVISLLRLNVTQLITIGGDDTAFSAMKLEEKAGGRIRVVHVPKTIDNDLDLPAHVDTFGFQTARHIGVEIVKNLMVDAKTTSRWYFVIAMGRKAGHLALGIGKAAGATLTLIPEEFARQTLRLKAIVDTLVGRDHQAPQLRPPRRRRGHRRGRGARASTPRISAQLEDVERDAHGHIRIAEVNIGEILKDAGARSGSSSSGSRRPSWPRTSATSCAAPTRSPSTWSTPATSATAPPSTCSSGGNARDGLDAGRPLRADPVRARCSTPRPAAREVRLVDIHSTRYAIARRYMIRLRRDDFEDPHELAKFAATAAACRSRSSATSSAT